VQKKFIEKKNVFFENYLFDPVIGFYAPKIGLEMFYSGSLVHSVHVHDPQMATKIRAEMNIFSTRIIGHMGHKFNWFNLIFAQHNWYTASAGGHSPNSNKNSG
jgi:hypothetical protein